MYISYYHKKKYDANFNVVSVDNMFISKFLSKSKAKSDLAKRLATKSYPALSMDSKKELGAHDCTCSLRSQTIMAESF